MFTTSLDRSAAGRLTLVVGAAAGIGVVAVGALAVGGQGRLPEPPEQIAGQPQPVAPETEEPEDLGVSPDVYAEQVGLALSSAYEWEEPAPEEDLGSGTPGEPIVERTGDQPVRYLGSIIGPDRRLAILSIDGHQRILAQGAGADGVQLVRVEDDRVIVRRAGGVETISKAEQVGPTYTILAGAGDGDAGGAGGGSERDGDGPDRDEIRRMIQERNDRLGIDAGDARLDAIRRGEAGVEGTYNRGAAGANQQARPAGGTASPKSGTSTGATGATGAQGRRTSGSRPDSGSDR